MMARSQFIEQVQILMDVQQIKTTENLFGKSNYTWLCSKKLTSVWMSTRDEFRLRQALTKITSEQQIKVMKQLLCWLDDNPNANCLKIPEVTLNLINNETMSSTIKQVNFSRVSSFRNSLRRFSSKVTPGFLSPPQHPQNIGRRSVTFNELPIIYQISQ